MTGPAGPAGLDRDLTCIDLETTGGSAAWHRIIEIGLVELDRDGAIREWSTLVNPGTRIPPAITDFTGISNEMVAAAPSFAEVHGELLARLRGRVFVAHNARFDYGFVRAELARLELRFKAPVLCTVKLSRRLFPSEPRHNLDAVIARLGLACTARHRALGDARVLRDLLAVLRRDIEPARLAAVADDLLGETPLPPQLPPELGDDLPETPGVYRFHGAGDVLLYVGKSRNIRSRVLAQLAVGQRGSRAQRLAHEVQRVSWTETAGELGALLIEARTIKDARPLENRRLRAPGNTWTLRFVPGGTEPGRVVAVEYDALDAAAQGEVYGLFRDRRAAERALAELARAHQLCARVLGLERGSGADAAAGSCFAWQLKRCRGACVGRESAALHDTRVRLALAAQRIRPWPYRGRVLLVECDWRGQQDLHVLGGWKYLATVRERAAADGIDAQGVAFDPDIYRILKRALAGSAGLHVEELD